MRLFSIALVFCSLGLTAGWILAQDGGSGGVNRPLDLPSPGAGSDEDEEDAPESITFYGSEYEGDGFFWCLDKSCSMGWGGEIGTLKTETVQSINQLSARAEFGAVAFSSNTIVWAPQPRRASSGNKSAAVAWVNGLSAEGGTCIGPAGVQTVQIANSSTKRRRQLLFLGDGQPFCGGGDSAAAALADITSANFEQIPLHTLYISASSEGIPFFQSLAQQNGGTFTLIP